MGIGSISSAMIAQIRCHFMFVLFCRQKTDPERGLRKVQVRWANCHYGTLRSRQDKSAQSTHRFQVYRILLLTCKLSVNPNILLINCTADKSSVFPQIMKNHNKLQRCDYFSSNELLVCVYLAMILYFDRVQTTRAIISTCCNLFIYLEHLVI